LAIKFSRKKDVIRITAEAMSEKARGGGDGHHRTFEEK
jgi:hypothetical protein